VESTTSVQIQEFSTHDLLFAARAAPPKAAASVSPSAISSVKRKGFMQPPSSRSFDPTFAEPVPGSRTEYVRRVARARLRVAEAGQSFPTPEEGSHMGKSVAEVMTANPRTVSRQDSVVAVARIMLEEDVGSVRATATTLSCRDTVR